MSYHIESCQALPHRAMLCYVMSSHVCRVVSCGRVSSPFRVVSCRVLSCPVVSCGGPPTAGVRKLLLLKDLSVTQHNAYGCLVLPVKKSLWTSWAGPTSKTQWNVRLCDQSPSATTSRQKRLTKKPSHVQEPHHLEDPAGHVTPCQASLPRCTRVSV